MIEFVSRRVISTTDVDITGRHPDKENIIRLAHRAGEDLRVLPRRLRVPGHTPLQLLAVLPRVGRHTRIHIEAAAAL